MPGMTDAPGNFVTLPLLSLRVGGPSMWSPVFKLRGPTVERNSSDLLASHPFPTAKLECSREFPITPATLLLAKTWPGAAPYSRLGHVGVDVECDV
jgi:hypothetical protein